MRYIQRFAITRPVATSMFFLGVVLMGSLAFQRLQINLLPAIEYPRLTVVTTFANAAPGEMENLVTRPLSEAVGTVSGITKIDSESLEGTSLITLQFAWGTNVDFAVMEVREKIDLVRGVLPQDAGRPVVSRFDPSQAAIMEVVFFPTGLEKSRDLRDFIRKNAKVFLDRVDGVAMVQLSGGERREIQVEVDEPALAAHRISLDEIGSSIASANLNYPAGHIKMGSKDVLVRSLGEYRTVQEIGKTIVGRNEQGTAVLLSSVAQVKDSYSERTGLARYNGKEAVIASLYREAGKNTVEVAARARVEVDNIRKAFGRDVETHIVYDESHFVEAAIGNLYQALLLGGILAFGALLLILRNLQSPVIVLTIVPVSILGTFIPMDFYGVSLNMMSLGGLELCIGMLFDSGNVVLAAIQRHAAEGLPRKEAALRGATEVASSVSSAILTTIIVFVPIIFLKSVVGVVFAEMALTITVSSLVNLVVALTLIPMLCSLKLPRALEVDLERFGTMQRAAAAESKITRLYEQYLIRFLNQPGRLIRTVLILVALAIVAIPFVKREFIPKVDRGEFEVMVKAARGTSLESTTETVKSLELELLQHTDIKHVIAVIGYDAEQVLTNKRGDVGTHLAQLRVIMKPDRSMSASELVSLLQEKIKSGQDVALEFVVRGDLLSNMLSSDTRAVSLELRGDDLDTLRQIGARIRSDLAQMPGVTDCATSMEEQAREFHVTFDRDMLAHGHFTTSGIARLLKTALKGTEATSLHVEDEEVDILVRVREEDRSSVERIERMRLQGTDGGKMYLSQVARIEARKGYTSILRSGAYRINRISADVTPGKNNEVFNNVEDYLDGLKLPEGYSIAFAGERENIRQSFKELIFASILSVVLIYMLLAGQYESFSYPLLMLGTIPLILVGIVPTLAITGKSLNISSFTGIILLVGIVVDNASLFFEYVEIMREEGMDIRTSIINAARIVLRPVMMNNGTNLLGMIPVAMELGEGTEFQSPMAIAVISGLVASVVLSLFLIPVLFYTWMTWREARGAKGDAQ